MDSLTLTIIGGVIVTVIGGIIILFIEYGYFQKKKTNSGASSLNEHPQPVEIISPENSTDEHSIYTNDTLVSGLQWTEAIANAVESFRILHEGKTVELARTNVRDNRAYLGIYVWEGVNLTSFSLVIDKSGEILEISQN